MEGLLALGVTVAVILVILVPMIAIDKIMNFYYVSKRKRFENQFPQYMKFLDEHDKLQQESLDIWNSTMPQRKREVERCIEEMKYYPEYSEKYQYYANKLDVARRLIEECQEKCDKKEIEIRQHVEDNRKVIESIKDVKPDCYQNWINSYKCLQ